MDEDKTEPSEQTKEIEAALGKDTRDSGPAIAAYRDAIDKQTIGDQDSEWDTWEANMQVTVDKLLDDSKMMKIAVLAVGGIAVIGLGVGALMSKSMAQVMQALNQLAENQNTFAQSLGMMEEPTPATTPMVAQPVTAKADLNGVDPTIDPNAEVAPPFEGPASEASDATKEQLASDKAAGIIDQFKGEGEPS